MNSSRYNTNVKSLFLSLVRGFLARVLVFYFLRYRRHCNCSPVEKKTRTRSAVFTARVGRSINNKVKRSLANGRKITGLGLSRFARREQTSKNNSVSILFLRCESRHTVRTIHLEILRTILLQMQTASEPLCESQWVSSRRAHEEARESSKERHGHRFTDVSLKLNSTASPFYVFLLSLSLSFESNVPFSFCSPLKAWRRWNNEETQSVAGCLRRARKNRKKYPLSSSQTARKDDEWRRKLERTSEKRKRNEGSVVVIFSVREDWEGGSLEGEKERRDPIRATFNKDHEKVRLRRFLFRISRISLAIPGDSPHL